MSEMEYNKGVLEPSGIDTELFDEDAFENAQDMGLVRIHDELYIPHWEVKRGELNGMNNTTVDEAGFIHFETYHYNGGAHWTELVEEKV
jgi:hypothetical protein